MNFCQSGTFCVYNYFICFSAKYMLFFKHREISDFFVTFRPEARTSLCKAKTSLNEHIKQSFYRRKSQC